MVSTLYVWEQTPKQLFACFRPIPSRKTVDRVSVEVLPFTSPKRRLLGTNFTYQLAISDTSRAEDVRLKRAACPTAPVSGDLRSGVLIFDGSKIIASYILPGTFTRNERPIATHPDYRRQGLATLAISQWTREVPTVTNIPPQPIHVIAAKTYFSAIKLTVAWAASTGGKEVAPQFRDAWANGVEEAEIMQELNLIEQAAGTPQPRMAGRFAVRR